MGTPLAVLVHLARRASAWSLGAVGGPGLSSLSCAVCWGVAERPAQGDVAEAEEAQRTSLCRVTNGRPTLLSFARHAVQRIGLDVQRWPQNEPLWRVANLLRRHGVDCVFDVGANDGGYATAIRRHGYNGRIISFEPLEQPFRDLRAKSMADPVGAWDSMRFAIGDQDGTVVINVAGNNAASSSVLPMLDRHRTEAPTSAYIGQEEVVQKTLDDIAPKMTDSEHRWFIKIDVQGYERAVLDGAAAILASERVVGLQMELSFIPLYKGAMSWREGLDFAGDLGMTLMSLDRGFTSSDGQMLQADAVFFRP